MAIMTKAEFFVAPDSVTGINLETDEVGVTLIIDYLDKSYEIIPPSIARDDTSRQPQYVAESTYLAYKKAMLELYGETIE